ncbi:SDR family oxidoreductase [Nodularia spumigena CS-584]|jgi:3-oxoacyl-[acyl-carrier protein] reductase|uniref:3-oxoacyl-[acyl-carrier protein] reductase n=3 Tax=Nodularia spumigena TaxID=70799 RepID=A0A2S0QA18_NODSP|nr:MULTISPECIES: SDR family oxidoreductase [Cyanophyceae]MDB9358499.1 SDR family oxidoreductase [Nodularia spumigena CS-587/03]AHJ31346.1 3-oxoacyl-[acyl-carrier protein] reductase [Nodularia spumigena CCY9414]AVZ31263.1 3-oxoacyl-[acyl-carrier protein] reductase [Nodularia spumigena UHCC 0039]EAW43325.1 Short-chain dehydrogenase/reductase SDR [Nodularia spumigena CCY9414]KZL49075.1 short-chain dehydrogenase [Nodularia spumigena CENA596]
MDLGLKGKVALVTGASAGIGLAVAQTLAQEGCKLVICGRGLEKIQQTERLLIQENANLEILSLVADVHKAEDSQNLVNAALNKFGKIDILINNSEGASFASDAVETLSDDDWRLVFEAKLMGYIRMTNLVLPGMKNQNWGRIINIVGTSGKEPSPRLIKSGVANAALMNFTKSVSSQTAKFNVLMTTVNPGLIDTPRHRQYLEIAAQEENQSVDVIKSRIAGKIPVGRLGSSDEVANLVVFLASECASYITGVTISIDGGLSVSAF